MKKRKELMGAHWDSSKYSKLYQLYRRVDTVACELEGRRQRGWVATTEHIAELYDIAIQLKCLDMEMPKED